jgi:Ca2+-binding EF-hand superfamily protein
MLDRNIDTRITAKELMKHQWYLFFSDNELTFSSQNEIKEKHDVNTKKNKQLLMAEMKVSADDSNSTLNRMVMVYMATTLSEEMYKKLRVAFIEIDADKNGTICIQEL